MSEWVKSPLARHGSVAGNVPELGEFIFEIRTQLLVAE
jgi:hypothetical protein